MTNPEALAAAVAYASGHAVLQASRARGQCYVRARQMQSALERDGHEVWLLEARPCEPERQQEHHFAVLVPAVPPTSHDEVGGTVLDLTARQFDPAAPAPWQGPFDRWLACATAWFEADLNVQMYQGLVHGPDADWSTIARWRAP